MKNKFSFIVTFVLMVTMIFSSAVMAFQDLPEGDEGAKILNLKDSGIIQGINESEFAPNGKLTTAQAVQLIVKGFDLNIDHIQFVKEPKASDYFDNVPDQAWYADAFIIAHHNGMDLPKNIEPEKEITREAFTHYLFQAMESKADLIFIEIYLMFKDEAEVTAHYMNSIQKMLIAKIASLDEQQCFHPKQELTRAEAAVMLHDAIEYVKQFGVNLDDGVSMSIEEINEEIHKVTLDWGEQPNPGYGISIDKIEFDDTNKIAVIYYSLHYPDPDKFYTQVISYPKAITYVASEYEVSMQSSPLGGGDDSVSSGAEPGSPGLDILPLEPDAPISDSVTE